MVEALDQPSVDLLVCLAQLDARCALGPARTIRAIVVTAQQVIAAD